MRGERCRARARLVATGVSGYFRGDLQGGRAGTTMGYGAAFHAAGESLRATTLARLRAVALLVLLAALTLAGGAARGAVPAPSMPGSAAGRITLGAGQASQATAQSWVPDAGEPQEPLPRISSVVAEATATGARLTIIAERLPTLTTSFALDAPRRLVFDMSGQRTESRTFPAEGPVAAVRIAQFDASTSRLVLDLAEPVALAQVEENGGNRLVITLVRSDDAAFRRQVASARRTVHSAPVEHATARPGAAVALGPNAGKIKPVSYRAARPIVVIDPGHGGKDVGAISVYNGRYEKDLTLAVSAAIKRELDKSGVVTTILTRSDDRFIPLHQRVQIARAARADLFIAVHADSAPNPQARGATIYTLSEVASDREAARLAALENKSDIIAGVDLGGEPEDVSDILIHLAQRNTKNASAAFAVTMQREMQSTMRFTTNYHRFAGFRVLKAADMPAVLLETGYISNMDDARWLHTTEAHSIIAKGVRRSVEAHFRRRIAQAG
jgi:N-acetylmuramoyl-L-alanine amidase